ncbi:MAG TPA: DUF3108 domain-containing protein [Stellaceae bacterium]|nr:DUF3108 domain-containing protein [Stellaceae bacterium]
MRILRICAIAAFALVTTLLSPPGARADGRLALEYDAFVAGFPALSFDFEIELDKSSYRVTGGARTNGLADVLMNYRMRTESDGRVEGTTLRPAAHQTRSDGHWRLRTTHIVFAGAEIEAEVTPPVDHPLEPDIVAGSLDPLTAILAAGREIGAQGRCDQRVKVFDGRRRFDLEFADGGQQHLQKGFGIFEGAARYCILHLHKVNGFESDNRKPGTPADVWFASVAEAMPPVPVKLDFNSQFGWASIYLTEVKTGAAAPPPAPIR